MGELHTVDLGRYAGIFKLEKRTVEVEVCGERSIDINEAGLVMHGSEANPLYILRRGLLPKKTVTGKFESDPQVCLGLNNTNFEHTIQADGARKNPAVQYAGNFGAKGIVYILSPTVKELLTYREFWEDFGDYKRGYGWVAEQVPPTAIQALVTKNLKLALAALKKLRLSHPVFRPDGMEIRLAGEQE